jgi:hypothetical protein
MKLTAGDERTNEKAVPLYNEREVVRRQIQ